MSLLTRQEEEDAEVVEMTIEEAREIIDGDVPSNLMDAIDKAQGSIFGRAKPKTAVVVVRIHN